MYLDDFYVVKLTYHTHELFYTLLFHRARIDFPEYILHHLVTLALISSSYSLNYIPIGAITLLIHDLSDAFVSLFKLCSDVTPKSIEAPAYVLMVGSWVYFRLWFFPVHIIYGFYAA